MIKQILNPKNWLPRAVALSVAVVVYVVLTNLHLSGTASGPFGAIFRRFSSAV